MRIKYKVKSLLGYIIAIAVLAIMLGTIAILSNFTPIAEYISYNINQYVAYGIGYVSSLMPFSLFEVFIVLCIIFVAVCMTYAIFQLVKRRPLGAIKGIFAIITVVLAISVAYSMLASFPYNRASIPLPYSDKEYSSSEINEVIDYYLNDFNAISNTLKYDSISGYSIPPKPLNELNQDIIEEYKRLNKFNYYYNYTPQPKTIYNNWLLNQSHILGITFLPTGEAHYNKTAPTVSLPPTIAHELAHAKGVMREGDANMTAYYIMLTSDNQYLKYCGYIDIFWQLSNMWIMNNDTTDETLVRPIDKLNDSIVRELKAIDDYWNNFDSFINDVSAWFNDIYLMMSGSSNGSDSYWDFGDSDTVIGDGGEVIVIINYSRTEKMFLHIYEQRIPLDLLSHNIN